MIRLAAAFVLAATSAAPALAQTADADLKAFASTYVQSFNKGDAPKLARDFYDIPDMPQQVLEKKFSEQLADLRKEEFGKMELFGVKTCSAAPDSGKLQITFVYNYTYGGVMPPGEQTTVFAMKKKDGAWRIVASDDKPAGQELSCS